MICEPLGSTAFLSPMPCGCFDDPENCDYAFENGFVIYKRSKSFNDNSIAYPDPLPLSVQVNIAKLKTGELLVSLRRECSQELQQLINFQ